MLDGSSNTIGGTAPGAANVIAFNGGDGVEVVTFLSLASRSHRILSNSIYSNGGLGIDLSPDGITANDAGDADTGSNDLQNKPVLTSATTSGATTIKGKLNSTPKKIFLVQFFSNPSGDEGKKFIGQKNVSTDGGGNVSFTFKPAHAVAARQFATATATGPGGTSEFSAPRKVVRR